MNSFDGLDKAILFVEFVLIVAGPILLLWPKIPWMGKLPGDIIFKGEKVSFYFPITTCNVVSILLTLLFPLFKR